MNKTKIYLSIAIILVVLILMLNIELQYTINGPGKLLPSRELYIYNGTDGRIYNSLVDYRKGLRDQFNVYSFERGDIFNFVTKKKLKSGQQVELGDTIGTIYSSENYQELIGYENLLNELTSFLNVSLTGLKDEELSVLEKEYEYSNLQYAEHTKLFKRYKVLYEKELISIEEYDIEEGKNKLLKLSIDIARTKLDAAKTGVKPSNINYIHEQINIAERNLHYLRNKISELTITSPIEGLVERNLNSDTLVTISDVSDFVLLIPIKLSNRKFIYREQSVEFIHPSADTVLAAGIIDINNKIEKINETDVISVFANSITKAEGLYPGMIVNTKIYCEHVNLLKYILLLIS